MRLKKSLKRIVKTVKDKVKIYEPKRKGLKVETPHTEYSYHSNKENTRKQYKERAKREIENKKNERKLIEKNKKDPQNNNLSKDYASREVKSDLQIAKESLKEAKKDGYSSKKEVKEDVKKAKKEQRRYNRNSQKQFLKDLGTARTLQGGIAAGGVLAAGGVTYAGKKGYDKYKENRTGIKGIKRKIKKALEPSKHSKKIKKLKQDLEVAKLKKRIKKGE